MWKQSKCPSMDDTKRMCYTHTPPHTHREGMEGGEKSEEGTERERERDRERNITQS